MYAFMQGKIFSIEGQSVIINNHGIGYKILVPQNALEILQKKMGEEITLYLTFVVREDAQALYGFFKKEEKELFEMLISISGVGPKIGLAFLGHMEMKNLLKAFAEEDVRLLSSIPGIGKKTAERIIVEMKGKLKNIKKSFGIFFDEGSSSSSAYDAIQALIHLGYSALQAQSAVQKVLEDAKNKSLEVSELITLALKNR